MKRYSLSGQERIKSKKDFERIYNSGKTVYSSDNKLKAIYLSDPEENSPGVKIAAAVSKKAGNAVWRNRVKRIIRESYRLNKEKIVTMSKESSILLLIVFSAHLLNEKKQKIIRYNNLQSAVLDIINRIESDVKPNHS